MTHLKGTNVLDNSVKQKTQFSFDTKISGNEKIQTKFTVTYVNGFY